MINIGWIGCGTHAAEMLLPQLVAPAGTPRRVMRANGDRLALVGDRYGVTARYTDARRCLRMRGSTRSAWPSGPALHARIGAAAMERGLAGVHGEAARRLPPPRRENWPQWPARTGKPCVVGFMKRYSTANRIAGNILSGPEFGVRAGLLGEYMTAPGYFVGNPDYTGFLLHHCVHAMDLVPWLMGEPVTSCRLRGVTKWSRASCCCMSASVSPPGRWRRWRSARTSRAARRWSGGR